MLPRRFGFIWQDLIEDELIQVAYRVGPTERYLYGQPIVYCPLPSYPSHQPTGRRTDFVNYGFLSWESAPAFKRQPQPYPFAFLDKAVAVGSDNLEIIEPSFSFWPAGPADDVEKPFPTGEVMVENIPYHFVISIPQGWDLQFLKGEQDAEELGIWIENFRFTRNPQTRLGHLSSSGRTPWSAGTAEKASVSPRSPSCA